jgi:ribulose kinase
MVQNIIDAIDAEITRLTSARALLSGTAVSTAKRKPGRPAKVVAVKAIKNPIRKTMSAEARDRIRQAQIKRWAAAKKTTKPNLNATVSPIPAAKKRAAKPKA